MMTSSATFSQQQIPGENLLASCHLGAREITLQCPVNKKKVLKMALALAIIVLVCIILGKVTSKAAIISMMMILFGLTSVSMLTITMTLVISRPRKKVPFRT